MGGPTRAAAFALGISAMLLLGGLTSAAWNFHPSDRLHATAESIGWNGESIPAGLYNASICELVNSTYRSPPVMQPNVSAIYSVLCHRPGFLAEMQHWGGWYDAPSSVENGTLVPGGWHPNNFTIDYTKGPNSSSSPFPSTSMVAIFMFLYLGPQNSTTYGPSSLCEPCAYEVYWLGDLWNDSLSGPLAMVYEEVCAGCPSTPAHSGLSLSFLGYLVFGSLGLALIAFVAILIWVDRPRKS